MSEQFVTRIRGTPTKWPEVVDGAVLHGGIKVHMVALQPRTVNDKRRSRAMKKKKIESGLTIACGPTLLVSSFLGRGGARRR
jgi:hypothetical protein